MFLLLIRAVSSASNNYSSFYLTGSDGCPSDVTDFVDPSNLNNEILGSSKTAISVYGSVAADISLL